MADELKPDPLTCCTDEKKGVADFAGRSAPISTSAIATCVTTKMATTLPMNCNKKTLQFSGRSGPGAPVVAQLRACHQPCPRPATVAATLIAKQWARQQPCPRSATVISPRASARSGPWAPVVENNGHVQDLHLWNIHGLLRSQEHGHHTQHNNGHVNNLAQDLQLWSLHGVLLHSRDHGHLSLHNNGHVKTLSTVGNCDISAGFCTVKTMGICR